MLTETTAQLTPQRLKLWLTRFFFPNAALTVRNISILGLLLALFLLLDRFVKIDVGPLMRLGFSHLVIFLVCIIFGFSIGLGFALFTHVLTMAMDGRWATWIWQFMMQNVIFAVIFSCMRLLFYLAPRWKIIISNVLNFLIAIISTTLIFSFQNEPSSESIANYVFYIVAPLPWIFAVSGLVISFMKKYRDRVQENFYDPLIILCAVGMSTIFGSWIWGSYLQMEFLRRLGGTLPSDYIVYFMLPRIVKSLISVPVTTVVIYLVMRAIVIVDERLIKLKK